MRDRGQLAPGAPDGAGAPVVLASTHQRALEIVPLEILKPYSVDVPADAAALDE